MKHPIITIPFDNASDLECVLLSITDDSAILLYVDDMTLINVPEYVITYTDDTVEIEDITLSEVA